MARAESRPDFLSELTECSDRLSESKRHLLLLHSAVNNIVFFHPKSLSFSYKSSSRFLQNIVYPKNRISAIKRGIISFLFRSSFAHCIRMQVMNQAACPLTHGVGARNRRIAGAGDEEEGGGGERREESR